MKRQHLLASGVAGTPKAPDDSHPMDAGKKHKKKARWRDQKTRTVLVKQLGFETGAPELRRWLGAADVAEVRLVKDRAASFEENNKKKHKGLAYAVCVDEAAAQRVLHKAEGGQLGGRRLSACLLGDDDADDLGRVARQKKKSELLAANAVAALAARQGLELDSKAIQAMRSSPHAIVSRALADAGKAKESAKNPSAYALGVLKRLKREPQAEEATPKARPEDRKLAAVDVDRLVDAAVARANGGFGAADVDGRARDYLRDFDEADARTALATVADCVSTKTKRNGRVRAKKQHLMNNVASPSAFLMGILRDLKKSRGELSKKKRKPSGPAPAPDSTKTRSPPFKRKKPAR